jgi:hypothetical protein
MATLEEPEFGLENVSITAPLPATEALSDAMLNAGYRYFLLDLATGLVQPIGPATAISSEDPFRWLDEDTLLLDDAESGLELDLDGIVRAYVPPQVENVELLGIAPPSGNWRVLQQVSGSGALVYYADDAVPRFRVANANRGVWSPTRDVHLMSGNVCTRWDLFTFEPATATLTNLTATDDRAYRRFYTWAPDGSHVAASAASDLALIDTATNAIETLLRGGDDASLRPIAFSPSGARLVVHAGFPPAVDCPMPPYPETYLEPGLNRGAP